MTIQTDIYRTQTRMIARALGGNVKLYTNDDGKFEVYKDMLGETARPATANDVIAHSNGKIVFANWAGTVHRADVILPSPEGVTLIVDALNKAVIMTFEGETVVHKYDNDVLGLREALVNSGK